MSDHTVRHSYFGEITKVYGGTGGSLVAVSSLKYDANATQTRDSIWVENKAPINRPEGVASRVAARVGDACIIQVCPPNGDCRTEKVNLIVLTEVDRFEDCP